MEEDKPALYDVKALELDWQRLLYKIKPQFKRKPNLQSMLFLIGVQELGQFQREFTKEEKQDLMHIAVCKLLSKDGYFDFVGKDDDGWPHYRATGQEQPDGLPAQEQLLKRKVLDYFQEQTDD